MDAHDVFHGFLKKDFFPLLRADGFKGSGNTFRRINGDTFHVLNIQGSKHGGECCVNLGVHFPFLPTEGVSEVCDPKKIKEYECAFRTRLHEPEVSDRWWNYDENESISQNSCANLIDTYRKYASLFFERFAPFPDVFEWITPADLLAEDLSNLPGAGTTIVRTILTVTRIMSHLGHKERCREFAELGLQHIGRGSSLSEEFQRFASLD